jgi:hypothetical protein
MTDRRLRDLHRLLTDEAARHGAEVKIEFTGGSHLKSTFSVGAREAFIITAFTASDWRFQRKVRSDARRVLRNLTTRSENLNRGAAASRRKTLKEAAMT